MIAGRLWSPLYTLLEGFVTSVLREMHCYVCLSGLFGPCRVIITLHGKMALPWGNERDFVHSWERPARLDCFKLHLMHHIKDIRANYAEWYFGE